jgi:hypothetical protein
MEILIVAALFPLGQVVATPGALDALEQAAESEIDYLARHAAGDWGELDEDDRAANDAALTAGTRLLSAYSLTTRQRLWIITEHDRSITTILLPSEY